MVKYYDAEDLYPDCKEMKGGKNEYGKKFKKRK